jgi:hypothetical protein
MSRWRIGVAVAAQLVAVFVPLGIARRQYSFCDDLFGICGLGAQYLHSLSWYEEGLLSAGVMFFGVLVAAGIAPRVRRWVWLLLPGAWVLVRGWAIYAGLSQFDISPRDLIWPLPAIVGILAGGVIGYFAAKWLIPQTKREPETA